MTTRSNASKQLSVAAVTTAYTAMKAAADRAQAVQPLQVPVETVALPPAFATYLSAVRENDQLTLSYIEFPEFSKTLRQTSFSEESLMRSVRALERDFQQMVDDLKTLQAEYGLQITREEGFIILAQPLARIEKRIASSDLRDQLIVTIDQIDHEAKNLRADREFEFHELGDRGYKVDEEEGILVITDPKNPERKEIRVATDFRTMISKETLTLLKDLRKGHPRLKTGPVGQKAESVTEQILVLAEALRQEVVPFLQTEEPQTNQIFYTPIPQVPPPPTFPEPVAVGPATVPMPQELQMPANHPAQPGARKRPSAAILPTSSVPPQPAATPSAEEPLYDLMVRLRHERDLKEQDIADAINELAAREKRIAVIFTEDLIDLYQRNKEFPKTPEQWAVLCQELIYENPQIPEGEKDKQITKYGYAKEESHALFWGTEGKVKSEDFGILTSRYRRQRGLLESQLAANLNKRLEGLSRDKKPTEEGLTYRDIARIQIGTQKPSPGLIKYMIRVMNGEDKGGNALTPLSDNETIALQTALEKVSPKMAPNSSNGAEEIQVTKEAQKMRADLLAMFKNENGQPVTLGEIVTLGQTISSTFSYFNVSNYLSATSTRYNSLSAEKSAEVKDVLGKVLQSFDRDPAKLEEFSQRFDQLTLVYLNWKQERARLISPRKAALTGPEISNPAPLP